MLKSHVNYGQVLLEILEPEEALASLKRGVELDKSSSNSLWNLSLALLLLGHYKEGWRFIVISIPYGKFGICGRANALFHRTGHYQSCHHPVILS